MSDEQQIKSHIYEWIEHISISRAEIGHFSVCPFAKGARLDIKIVDSEKIVIEEDDFDIVIYVVENEISPDELKNVRDQLNFMHPQFIFLDDHRLLPGFIQGVQTTNGKFNLLLKQSKIKLTEARKQLAKTGYYLFWNQEMIDDVFGTEFQAGIDSWEER